jgi:ABC-2 type transport system permease protein
VKQVWLRLVRGLDNPIVRQEGMSRMRTWRAPLAITIYLGLLGAFGYSVFAVGVIGAEISHSTQSTTALGAATFDSMTVFELVLVLLFAPALAAGAISGEKERQTFDSLLVSRVSAFGIVWGKLVASLAYILLLVASAIPLFAFVFIFGSIEPDQILITQALIVVTAFTIGSVALFWSALFKRTLAATVSAYGSAFALYGLSAAIGWLFTYIITIRYQNAGVSTPPDFGLHPLIFGNPFMAFFTLLVPQASGPVSSIHIGRLFQLLVMDAGPVSQWGPAITSWQLSLYTQGALALLCVFGAVMLVRGRRALPLRRVAVKRS